eukprot:3865806-Pyramimonas_sp.AAC.1
MFCHGCVLLCCVVLVVAMRCCREVMRAVKRCNDTMCKIQVRYGMLGSLVVCCDMSSSGMSYAVRWVPLHCYALFCRGMSCSCPVCHAMLCRVVLCRCRRHYALMSC